MSEVRLRLQNLGPIAEADLRFKDLTVFVGPQASGKSIALQFLKLALDLDSVHGTMLNYGLDWDDTSATFFDRYLGEGMSSVWNEGSSVQLDGKSYALRALTRAKGLSRRASPDAGASKSRVFYIPAQRVMIARDGITRPFTDYRTADPFVLREFSQLMHEIVQNELSKGGAKLFPKSQRFNEALKKVVSDHIYGGWEVILDASSGARELALVPPASARGASSPTSLKYMAWSAGQREFTPLLFGLYRLIPSGATRTKIPLTHVVLEEPESGLHPRAIAGVLAFVLELLRRGYKVAISTHSLFFVEAVWALARLREHGGTGTDVVEMLLGRRSSTIAEAAAAALKKEYAVYYFDRGSKVQDISSLDLGSEVEPMANWGGLISFSERVERVIARTAARRALESEG